MNETCKGERGEGWEGVRGKQAKHCEIKIETEGEIERLKDKMECRRKNYIYIYIY